MPLKDDLRKRSPADIRDERDLLGGWIRQPEVRWLDPSILAKAGVEVAVSGTFGKFADKRELQTQPQGPFDYSSSGELWIDYLSDTGDGWAATQTMAWLLAQPSLRVGEADLPRGKILLLGGDQVYPSATAEAYEDRFRGPFAAALPSSPTGHEPELFATPGNHDWYDGLVSFLRLFCVNQWVGGWRTRQRRSYFALRLPNDWSIWAIDIQLDTYLDDVQLQYFREQRIGPRDKIVLLTAKPSWVAATDDRVEPPSWKYLSYFEERMVRDTGARLVATITGDRHHYSRYEPEGEGAEDAPTRITAGGGGAYLSATHTLPETVRLKTLKRKRGEQSVDQPAVVNRRAGIYPTAGDSRRLSNGIVKLALLNPAFGRLLGALYAVIAVAMLSALNLGAAGVLGAGSEGFAVLVVERSFFGFVGDTLGDMTIVLALLLLAGIAGGVDIPQSKLARLGVAVAQTAVHLLLVALAVYVAVNVVPDVVDSVTVIWLVGVALAFAVGASVGTTVFALFLLIVHKFRGEKAQATANTVFTGQSIVDYKNLLRMHLGRDGGLEIHALGVDKVCREWSLEHDGDAPRFEPRGAAPRAHPIDRTVRFDAAGNRVA